MTAESDTEPDDDYRINSYGAHFVEARVDIHTGEITVPRMLGVFSIGRVVNPRTVRSQLLGGMTFGISMALFEESVRDGRFGHVVTQDLATYHFPTNADVRDIDAIWLDDVDERATPMGSRGAGEIGNVGSAAAVVNAVCNATGTRVRELRSTRTTCSPPAEYSRDLKRPTAEPTKSGVGSVDRGVPSGARS